MSLSSSSSSTDVSIRTRCQMIWNIFHVFRCIASLRPSIHVVLALMVDPVYFENWNKPISAIRRLAVRRLRFHALLVIFAADDDAIDKGHRSWSVDICQSKRLAKNVKHKCFHCFVHVCVSFRWDSVDGKMLSDCIRSDNLFITCSSYGGPVTRWSVECIDA